MFSKSHEEKGSSTRVQVQRDPNHWEQPQDLVEPADIAAEPLGVLVRERLEKQVEDINRRERQAV